MGAVKLGSLMVAVVHRRRGSLCGLAGLCLVATLLAAPNAGAEPPVGFNRDIRPILSDKCFFCHGPDKAKRKSGLRLDVREAVLESGAIVPGKPDDSAAWQRIIVCVWPTGIADALPRSKRRIVARGRVLLPVPFPGRIGFDKRDEKRQAWAHGAAECHAAVFVR